MKVLVLAVALCAAASSAAPAFAQAPLPVPYLPQTEALCGGAAAAMVMRFWGARGVYADEFAPLVERAAGGIRTSVLSGALATRGWRSQAGVGDLAHLAQEVGKGRPVIALLEDRPGRFHYVVVVAASPGGRVILHDPARAPSRVMEAGAFDRKWQKSHRWMLVLLPGTKVAPPTAAARESDGEGKGNADLEPSCQTSVDEGVELAQRGDRSAARRALEAAARRCPSAGSAWRELAGVDALDGKWDEAAAHAKAALARDTADALAWRVLATAEYLQHHDLSALAAWNRVSEPRVDLVEINGLGSTRYAVIADAIGVRPRQLLTPDAIRIAQKRVRDVPAISSAVVTFHPLDRGEAQVDATIIERARAPLSYPAWGAIGLSALANSEVAASFANISGGGDVADVSWRWWEHRPRIAAAYAAPGPLGIWSLDASRETQTFGLTRFEETRTRFGAEVSQWIDQRIRLTGGVALERWSALGRAAALSSRVQWWPVLDRLSVEGGATGWRGVGAPFAAADMRLQWRSQPAAAGMVMLANAGYQLATSSAPASIWPGADTGHARDVLLRAHPLLSDGVIAGGVFGRRVASTGVEVQYWRKSGAHRVMRFAPAVFVDSAHATRGLATSDNRVHYDMGVGVRVALLGFGVLRADVGHGLRDGRTALSFGWQR